MSVESRERAEDLVARMWAAPEAFAGTSLRPHEALLREHYHAGPEAILGRARVGAGTGDDADFLAVHAMPRAAWRRLGRGRTFTLTLPADFYPEVPLRWLGRDPESRTERVTGTTIAKALLLDGTPAVLTVEVDSTGIARCSVDRPVSAEGIRAAHDAAIRMLGLAADPAPFERRRDPYVRRLVRRRRGLRVPLTSSVFEALVWTIAGQQVNLTFAYRLRRVVLELAGKPVDGFIAHPAAADVAKLDYEDLTRRQWSRRKAEYVIDVARAVASGELDADALPRQSATSVRERLEGLRGFGAWSANYVMMRGCGLADCVPFGDTGLTSGLQRFFALDERPDRARTDELMARFAPYRSLATFHFWAGGDDD
jgi:3-methyladenine DNA glycosylase/8-oxoguanine DNA glycosylase